MAGAVRGAAGPFFLISGPCVIEPAPSGLVAARLGPSQGLGIPYVFKASYDKANRSSLGSFRDRAWGGASRSWPVSVPNTACPS